MRSSLPSAQKGVNRGQERLQIIVSYGRSGRRLLAVFVLFFVILRFTTVGRNIYYLGSNIRMSWMSGIDVSGTRNFAFGLSGFAAAIAAIMQSCTQFGGDPTLGKVYILQSIAAVVVGGTALTEVPEVRSTP